MFHEGYKNNGGMMLPALFAYLTDFNCFKYLPIPTIQTKNTMMTDCVAFWCFLSIKHQLILVLNQLRVLLFIIDKMIAKRNVHNLRNCDFVCIHLSPISKLDDRLSVLSISNDWNIYRVYKVFLLAIVKEAR